MSYKYPKGHPCFGCPYKFDVDVPSCTMGSDPKNCVWRFYNRMRGIEEKIVLKEKVATNTTKKKLDNCMEMLINVGEQKFGKAYADKLRRKQIEK